MRAARIAALALLLLAVALPAVAGPRERTATNIQVSCGTTSTALRAAKDGRAEIIVTNHSSTVAYVCLDSTCDTTTGRALPQYGSLVETVYTGALSCITASSTATVSVQEIP